MIAEEYNRMIVGITFRKKKDNVIKIKGNFIKVEDNDTFEFVKYFRKGSKFKEIMQALEDIEELSRIKCINLKYKV